MYLCLLLWLRLYIGITESLDFGLGYARLPSIGLSFGRVVLLTCKPNISWDKVDEIVD